MEPASSDYYYNPHDFPSTYPLTPTDLPPCDTSAFALPRFPTNSQTQYQNIPRTLQQQQYYHQYQKFHQHHHSAAQSPAHSLQTSLDEPFDLSDNECSPALFTWDSASLSGSVPAMTSSSLESRHMPAAAHFIGEWADPCGVPVTMAQLPDNDHFDFDPAAIYSDFPFDLALDSYNMTHRAPDFVDPSLIEQAHSPSMTTMATMHSTANNAPVFGQSYMLSPTLSYNSRGHHSHLSHDSRSTSPNQPIQLFSYPSSHPSNHPSNHASPHSSYQAQTTYPTPRRSSTEGDDESRPKNQFPCPDCGKHFKDLKAHKLTHQDERPEKCPIPSCEFHKRGFARRYDRNRHLVTTHYKSTIVCGFCPGSGSAAEKSFNRTDVFKRHLVAVHGVEQMPPNGRKKSPATSGRQSPVRADGTTGKCSTCGGVFGSAQDLFEHLDDCVLRVVQQIDPGEATNEKLLMSVAEDEAVRDTMSRHRLDDSPSANMSFPADYEDEDLDDTEEHRSAHSGKPIGIKSKLLPTHRSNGVRDGRITKISNSTTAVANSKTGPRVGLTFSKGGVAFNGGRISQRRRREYPRSWGCPSEKMKLKKRVLTVFDGSRRLWKDDMMLGNEHEVRVPIGNGQSYVTDLDVQSLKRAEAFHGASEEERGVWSGAEVEADVGGVLHGM